MHQVIINNSAQKRLKSSSSYPNELYNKHAPYPVPETNNMRYISLLALVIFGTSYLIIKCLISYMKSENKFFMKAIKNLGNQTLLYFILVGILICLYTYEVLDFLEINWEYLICGIAMFGIAWILFSLSIIGFSVLSVRKWNQLESAAKSFSNLY